MLIVVEQGRPNALDFSLDFSRNISLNHCLQFASWLETGAVLCDAARQKLSHISFPSFSDDYILPSRKRKALAALFGLQHIDSFDIKAKKEKIRQWI